MNRGRSFFLLKRRMMEPFCFAAGGRSMETKVFYNEYGMLHIMEIIIMG